MRLGVAALWLAGGCTIAAADHERLGDQAFREGRWAKALGEYQAAQRSGVKTRVWAKAGSSAIRAEDFAAAVDAYAELARQDPTRAAEAASGLERVARAAERRGAAGNVAVAKAVLALRGIAPGRPLGRLALATLAAASEPSDAIGILPSALATAGSARGVDTLLLRLGDAQRATVACDGAARSYRTLLRRTEDGRLRVAARAGLADCALLLGQDALGVADGPGAEQWFDLVLGYETETARGWRARIGLGDARVLQGDALGAAVAYQTVASAPGVPDSVRAVAVAKLNGLGAASAEPPADGDA